MVNASNQKPFAHLVQEIVEQTAGDIGHKFLTTLVTALRDSMDVAMAWVGIGIGNPSHRARAIAALKDGQPAQAFEYELDGFPCSLVYKGQRIIIPCDLWKRFPKDEPYSGYVGVPLVGLGGEIAGHIAVLSSSPIVDEMNALNIVNLFSLRAEAELRRMQADEQREDFVSELKSITSRLRQRYRSLHEANEFKTKLLGLIAHDLRNPLAAIISRAELTEAYLQSSRVDSDKAKNGCAQICEIAERMNKLIHSTLERAHQESVGLQLVTNNFDLSSVIDVAVEVNRNSAENKNILLIAKLQQNIEIVADETLIFSVFDNLISNAIKFSCSNTTVNVNLRRKRDRVIVEVKDEGQGLTKNDLNNVFKPYQTLTARPTAGEPSVGLGLANVKEIVSAHGGKVTVESPGKDKGTTFIVCL